MASLLNMSGSRLVGSKVLPYDAEIEYLENTGIQWIDTMFVNTINTKFDIDFQLTEGISDDRKIIGTANIGFAHWVGKWRPCAGDFWSAPYNTDTDRHIVHVDDSWNFYLDDNFIPNGTPKRTPSPLSMYLFSINKNNKLDGACAIMKLYQCRIYDNGSIVRDFVPVRIGTTGYMYDKVSKQLFGNAGTGNFILGADKH